MLKQYHMIFYFIFVAVESMAANFAHPITPTLISNLNLPDYSFGMLFAGMAFTNFLFSPLWAKQVQRMGSKKVLGICCVGYSIGQLMFSLMQTLPMIMLARLISGFFVGGISVSFLTYIIHVASIQERGKLLAYSATTVTVFSAFGYLIGGFCGVLFSIQSTFLLQSGVLFIAGVMFYLLLKDDKQQNIKIDFWKDANPFKAFIDSKSFMNVSFAILFAAIFLASTASTAYDQNFNYYLMDQFGFDSRYNGMLKALVGFISLFANTTICIWIMKKTDIKKSVIAVLGGTGTLLVLMTFMNDMSSFMLVNLIFFAFNAMVIPLTQDLCATASVKESSLVMGFYNAMKSLGMIFGALFAGFLYAYGPDLPFLYAGIFYFIAMLCIFIYRKRMMKGK